MLHLLHPRSGPATPATAPAKADAAPWRSLVLPGVGETQARVARLCHGALAARLAHRLRGGSVTLAPSRAPADSLRAGRALLRLTHPAGVAAASIALASFPELAILQQEPTPEPPAADGLRRVVTQVLLTPLFKLLGTLGLRGLDVLDIVPADRVPPPEPAGAIAIEWGPQTQRRDACLWLPEPLLEAAVAALAALPAPPLAQAPAPDLRVPGSLILGTRAFALERLQALEPGDVLLHVSSAQPLAGHDGAAEFVLQPFAGLAAWGTAGLLRAVAPARIHGRQLTLSEPFTMTDETLMPDPGVTDRAPGAHEPGVDLSELEIPISFEIDTVALPLAQLLSLGPGYVLELPQRIEQVPLRLVSYGRSIGSAELVAVGDHLGVRILRIVHRPPRAEPTPAG